MCHGERKQKYSAKPEKSQHKNAVPYKRRAKYRDDYREEYN